MDLKRKSSIGVLWVFAEQFGGQALNFIVTVVLARILYPADFGVIAMAALFIAVGISFVDNGLTSSLIVKKNIDQIDLSSVFFLNILFGFTIYGLLFFLAPLIAEFYDTILLTDILRVYTLVFVINSLYAVHKVLLVRAMDFKRQFLITVPSLFISGIVGVCLAYRGFGVWSLIYMYIMRSISDVLLYWVIVGWRPAMAFSFTSAHRHFTYGIRITASGLIHTIYMNLYNMLIGKIYTAEILGLYHRAASTKDLLVNNLSSSISRVLFPAFSELQHDDAKLKSAYRLVSQQVFFWICPVLSLCIVIAYPMFEFVFTEKWVSAAPYFQILCVVGILTPIQSYNVNILKVKGRADLVLKLEFVKKPIFIIGIFVAINYGIYALLWNHVISNLIGLFINSYYSGKIIKYSLFDQLYDLRHTFLSSIVSVSVSSYISYLIPRQNVFLVLVIVTVVFFSIYLLISIFFKNPAYKEAIKLIKSLLKK